MEDAGRTKAQDVCNHFMDLARRVGAKILDGQAVGTMPTACCYALGDAAWSTGRCATSLGMSRVRVAYTAGEAIGPDLFVFYRSIGVNLKQLYGSTETSVFVCIQPDHGQVKSDTVGPCRSPGVELKFTRG